MKWFRNLSVAKKLGVGFGILELLMTGLGVFCMVQLSKVNNSNVEIADLWLPSVQVLAELKFDLSALRRDTLNYMVATDKKQHYLEKINKELSQITEDEKQYEPLIFGDKERGLFREFRSSWDKYLPINARVMELSRQKKVQEAVNLMQGEGSKTFEIAAKYLGDNVELNSKGAAQAARQSAVTYASSKYWVIGLLIAVVAVGIALAFNIAHAISTAVTKMLIQIQEIAANNLSLMDLEINSKDEIGQAVIAMNTMKNNLRNVIQSIAGTAEHVASASEEISSSASQQAQGANTQKDQTSQMATAMQEMSASIQQVSENSNKAADSSLQAAETARQGGDVVDEALKKMRVIADSVQGSARKMEELSKSSDQIGRIAGVIDDIADQTNLLALNAAIEAARAGEQGRGFAVVADEVRKLAERTTTATKEIAQMIKNIQDETRAAVTAMNAGTKQVEEGVKSTTIAGDSLRQIIQMSEAVGEQITQIATAATEQSSASEEINKNMEQIAMLVKESANGAEQSAKACQDLSGLALDLQNMVGRFDLGTDENYSPRPGKRRAQLTGQGKFNPLQSHERQQKALAAGAR